MRTLCARLRISAIVISPIGSIVITLSEDHHRREATLAGSEQWVEVTERIEIAKVRSDLDGILGPGRLQCDFGQLLPSVHRRRGALAPHFGRNTHVARSAITSQPRR
jgi:hypothetical protein